LVDELAATPPALLLLLPSALSFAPRFDDRREKEERLFLLPIATIGSFGTHLVIIIIVFFEFDVTSRVCVLSIKQQREI
jgi:hypothetical protein